MTPVSQINYRSLSKALRSPWLIWGVAVAFVFFQFFLQLSAGVMVRQLRNSFDLTALGAGALASSFYFIYVLLQTPAGMLVDQIGPRRLLGGGGIVCGLGCLVFATSHTVLIAFLGRLLMGGGASFAFVSSLYLAAQWFPEQRFAMMVALAEAFGMLGVLIGNVYLAHVLQETPWQSAMLTSTVISITLGVACYIIVRDKPEDDTLAIIAPSNAKVFYRNLIWIVTRPRLWINGFYAGSLFSVITVFAALWGIPFIALAQKTTLPVATFETALTFVGIAVGSPLMGWLYPRLTDKNRFLAFTALASAVLSIILIYATPTHAWINALLFLCIGLTCSSYVFNYSIANQVVPQNTRSTSIGFTNTLCVATAPLLQPIVGWILHFVSRHENMLGQEIYSIRDYHWALSIVPTVLLIAAAIATYLPRPSEGVLNIRGN